MSAQLETNSYNNALLRFGQHRLESGGECQVEAVCSSWADVEFSLLMICFISVLDLLLLSQDLF